MQKAASHWTFSALFWSSFLTWRSPDRITDVSLFWPARAGQFPPSLLVILLRERRLGQGFPVVIAKEKTWKRKVIQLTVGLTEGKLL